MPTPPTRPSPTALMVWVNTEQVERLPVTRQDALTIAKYTMCLWGNKQKTQPFLITAFEQLPFAFLEMETRYHVPVLNLMRLLYRPVIEMLTFESHTTRVPPPHWALRTPCRTHARMPSLTQILYAIAYGTPSHVSLLDTRSVSPKAGIEHEHELPPPLHDASVVRHSARIVYAQRQPTCHNPRVS